MTSDEELILPFMTVPAAAGGLMGLMSAWARRFMNSDWVVLQ